MVVEAQIIQKAHWFGFGDTLIRKIEKNLETLIMNVRAIDNDFISFIIIWCFSILEYWLCKYMLLNNTYALNFL